MKRHPDAFLFTIISARPAMFDAMSKVPASPA
jgi:hypothetical protein